MYWTTKKGEELEISNMETSHIENCIKLLERNAENGVNVIIRNSPDGDDDYGIEEAYTVYGEEYLDSTPYERLKKELNKRKI